MADSEDTWTTIGDYKVKTYPPVGAGAHATVFEAVHQTTGEKIAMKEIRYENTGKRRAADKELESLNIIKDTKHKNIVRLFSFEQKPDKLRLFMEYCELGSLNKFIDKEYLSRGRILDLVTKVQMMQQCASAVSFVHGLGIMHMDLKFDNILVKGEANDPVIKLTDFGISRLYENLTFSISAVSRNLAKSKTSKTCGSYPFQAPELFAGDEFDRSVDVFSLGLVFKVLIELENSNNTEDLELPRSVTAKRKDDYSAIGEEMVRYAKTPEAEKRAEEFPIVVEIQEDENMHVKRIKRMVLNMTKFRAQERREMSDVEGDLSDMIVDLTKLGSVHEKGDMQSQDNIQPHVNNPTSTAHDTVDSKPTEDKSKESAKFSGLFSKAHPFARTPPQNEQVSTSTASPRGENAAQAGAVPEVAQQLDDLSLDWFQTELTERQRGMLCTDKLFSKLSPKIQNINVLGAWLNITQGEIEQIKVTNPSSGRNQALELLQKWKQKCRHHTVEPLVRALRESNVPESSYTQEVLDFCQGRYN